MVAEPVARERPPGERLPVPLWLAGALLGLLGLVAGVVGLRALRTGGGVATPTVAGTAVAVVMTATSTEAVVATPTHTQMPTATQEPTTPTSVPAVQSEDTPTATTTRVPPTATVTETVEPTPTVTPSPPPTATWTPTSTPITDTPTPVPPTPTLVPPMSTPVPPTSTSTPVPPTPTRVRPTSTPVGPPAVVLQSLEDGVQLQGQVTFAWTWAGSLDEGEVYDVRVCKGESCQPQFGKTNTGDTTWVWQPDEGDGIYRWQVVVLRWEQGRVVAEQAPSAVVELRLEWRWRDHTASAAHPAFVIAVNRASRIDPTLFGSTDHSCPCSLRSTE